MEKVTETKKTELTFNCNQSHASRMSKVSSENKYTTREQDKVVVKPLNLRNMLKLSKDEIEDSTSPTLSPSGARKRRRPIKRIFSTITSTCVKKQFSNMMLYSSNRNTLKKGRASTVLEQVDSAGSNEDKDSEIMGDNDNFKHIVDHYIK